MEATKVISIGQGSLGFEIGENPRWRAEFTLEQVEKFNIREGKPLNVHLLGMEDTFANVEFGEEEKTTVPIMKVREDNDLFAPESSDETDTPDMNETLRGE
ncbi:MAG TPA: hypothetical protein VGC97_14680 [Pyrinomonadaceae bacterium]|jgi:hypothetical protein